MVVALEVVLEIVRVVAIRDALGCVAEGVKEVVTINALVNAVMLAVEHVPVSVSRHALVLVQHNVEMDAQLHVRPFAIKDVEELVQEIVLVHAALVAKGNVYLAVLMFVNSLAKVHVGNYAPRMRQGYSSLCIVANSREVVLPQ